MSRPVGQRVSDNAVLPKKTMRLLRHIQSRQSNSRLTPAAGVNPTRPKRNYLPLESERKKAITLTLSSTDASPPYGFMLLPGTISSGFAMKRLSFASSQMKSAFFIALE
jgi:hypothetical protein